MPPLYKSQGSSNIFIYVCAKEERFSNRTALIQNPWKGAALFHIPHPSPLRLSLFLIDEANLSGTLRLMNKPFAISSFMIVGLSVHALVLARS